MTVLLSSHHARLYDARRAPGCLGHSRPLESLLSPGPAVMRSVTGLPFRVKMAAISAAAVLLTLGVILIPVYLGSRDTLTRVQGERLLSIARSAGVSLTGEAIDSVADDGQTSPAFRSARG